MKVRISAMSSRTADPEIEGSHMFVTVHDALGIEYVYSMTPADDGGLRISCDEGAVALEPFMSNVFVVRPLAQ